VANGRVDDEEDESSSSGPESPPVPTGAVRRGKFEDEEDDSDVRLSQNAEKFFHSQCVIRY
jgi:hypothetical protein